MGDIQTVELWTYMYIIDVVLTVYWSATDYYRVA